MSAMTLDELDQAIEGLIEAGEIEVRRDDAGVVRFAPVHTRAEVGRRDLGFGVAGPSGGLTARG